MKEIYKVARTRAIVFIHSVFVIFILVEMKESRIVFEASLRVRKPEIIH